jgi:predicted ATP-grasp superfamily ATP-dependent carboligase
MKLLILLIPFTDWDAYIEKCKNCICITHNDICKYDKSEYKIMPICVSDYIKYNTFENNIFKNILENVDALNNKSKFGKYMLNHFPEYIPNIYYYNFNNETYGNTDVALNKKMIYKPNVNYSSNGIKIIYSFENAILKNCIIQEYIDHVEYFVGHFLVLNGIIYSKVYFSSTKKIDTGIKCGCIKDYITSLEISIDDNIFSKIFNNLNYSGFASADFIINNGSIVIFEINPRPGGSLIKNDVYFNIFIDKLLQVIS